MEGKESHSPARMANSCVRLGGYSLELIQNILEPIVPTNKDARDRTPNAAGDVKVKVKVIPHRFW